jgi:hypothetical protein
MDAVGRHGRQVETRANTLAYHSRLQGETMVWTEVFVIQSAQQQKNPQQIELLLVK